MDALVTISEKIELLVRRMDELKLENMQLKEDIEKERQTKEAVLARIENLLNRLQDIDIN